MSFQDILKAAGSDPCIYGGRRAVFKLPICNNGLMEEEMAERRSTI